jgi:hypothetical protein
MRMVNKFAGRLFHFFTFSMNVSKMSNITKGWRPAGVSKQNVA